MLSHWLSILRLMLLSGVVAVVLPSCGGDSSSLSSSPDTAAVAVSGGGDQSGVVSGNGAGTPASANTGSLGLLLTDAPSDEFAQINLTINRIELLSSDGSSFELFSGHQVVDLLGLRNYSTLFSVHHGVPTGLYNKIRMHLDDVELVRTDTDGAVTERIHPKLVANGKLDLNPRTELAIGPGKSLVLQLDLDANKSVQVHQTGGGKGKGKGPEYMFRPVVFIDLIDMVGFGGKLIRVEGVISSLNPDEGAMELCSITGISGCVTVSSSGGTTYFHDEYGSLGSLKQAERVDYGIGIGHMSLVNGQNHMQAEVIEVGRRLNFISDFMHLAGDVTVPPTDDSHIFQFVVRPLYGFNAMDPFRIEPLPGAKIFSSNGVPLDWPAINKGKVVEVEGVLVPLTKNPYVFSATTIYLDMSQVDTQQLSGTVTGVDVASRTLTLFTADTGDRCGKASDSASVYQVSGDENTGLSGARISFDQIKDGQHGDLYGQANSAGCYVADEILVR